MHKLPYSHEQGATYMTNLLFPLLCASNRRPQSYYHVVQRGETLWQIAAQYEIEPDNLIASNPQIKNPDMIFPGQVITVPL